jgi:hypothetical protein
MPVSQIGVQVPVVFSFAIAPAVFLFLHVYTLIRYDMLAANLHQFRIDLKTTVPLEAYRERCRQLLTNVEFVQAHTAPRGSTFAQPALRSCGLASAGGISDRDTHCGADQFTALSERYGHPHTAGLHHAGPHALSLVLLWAAEAMPVRTVRMSAPPARRSTHRFCA